jgi:Ca2+-binding EF-hand superfamily protein
MPPGTAGSDQSARQAQFNSDLFERLDLNDDGMLSAAEFSIENQQQARHELHQQRIFAYLDSNNDQVLTLEEMPGQRLILKDLDGDGEITRGEMRSGRPDKPAHPTRKQ